MADSAKPEVPVEAETAQETDVVSSARERFKRLGDEVQTRYKKVSEDVRRGAERASQEVRRGAERARETYEEVSDKAQQTYHRARSQASNLSREVSLYVRDNPGKALLMAAGVGFLLGLIARGRGGRSEEE